MIRTGFFTMMAAAIVLSALAPVAMAQQDDADGQDGYVPRAERDTGAVFTFVGSSKELKIVDNRSGETTYYSTGVENRIQRLSEEAQASAERAWRDKQAAADAAIAAEAEEQAAAEAAAAAEATEKSESSAEAPSSAEGSEG